MQWLEDAARHDYGTSGGSWTDAGEPKGCLHTTETGSWPGYDDGQKAPHATIKPTPNRGVDVRQHVAFDRAARALRNPPGGVQTNRDRVYQFELIGTCDLSTHRKYGYYYWPDADDAVLRDLYRKVVLPVSAAFHIPIRAPKFQDYPNSYGARGRTNTVRMSGATFDAFSGWLGHQHAPENDHGDPGAFPWARMLRLGQATTSAPKPAPTQPAVPPDNESEEQPMIVIRQEKGFWYILLGGKLVPLYAGLAIPPALPRLRVPERQWARFVAAGVVAKVA